MAGRYGDLIDGYVLDHADAGEAAELSVPTTVTRTLMTTLKDRERLARRVLASADALEAAA